MILTLFEIYFFSEQSGVILYFSKKIFKILFNSNSFKKLINSSFLTSFLKYSSTFSFIGAVKQIVPSFLLLKHNSFAPLCFNNILTLFETSKSSKLSYIFSTVLY